MEDFLDCPATSHVYVQELLQLIHFCLCQLDPPAGTDPDSLNCIITYCKREDIAQGEDIASSDIKINYSTVLSTCKAQPHSPGGKCGAKPGDNFDRVTVEARANPNYSGGARRRDTEPIERVISETLVWAQPPEESKREHARDFPNDLSKRQSPPDSVSAHIDSFPTSIASRH